MAALALASPGSVCSRNKTPPRDVSDVSCFSPLRRGRLAAGRSGSSAPVLSAGACLGAADSPNLTHSSPSVSSARTGCISPAASSQQWSFVTSSKAPTALQIAARWQAAHGDSGGRPSSSSEDDHMLQEFAAFDPLGFLWAYGISCTPPNTDPDLSPAALLEIGQQIVSDIILEEGKVPDGPSRVAQCVLQLLQKQADAG